MPVAALSCSSSVVRLHENRTADPEVIDRHLGPGSDKSSHLSHVNNKTGPIANGLIIPARRYYTQK